jgi:hypothetical protein
MSTPARGVFEARLHFTGRALYLAVAVFVVFLGVGPGHASAQSSAAIESIAMDLKTDREFSERWPGAGPRASATDQDAFSGDDRSEPRFADPADESESDQSPVEDRCGTCPGADKADEPIATDERIVLDRQEDFERVFDDNKSVIFMLCDAALRRAAPIDDRPALLLTISVSGQVTACEVVSAGFGTSDVASDTDASVWPSDVEDGDRITASDNRPMVAT